jgi:hypothetical protein
MACIALAHRIGASHWCIALAHRIGASHWRIALAHRIGAVQFLKNGLIRILCFFWHRNILLEGVYVIPKRIGIGALHWRCLRGVASLLNARRCEPVECAALRAC